MRSLRENSISEFVWLREPRPERYLLRATEGGDHFASLTREHGSVFAGTTTEGIWTFKRAGFLHPRVVVRAAGTDQDLAILHLNAIGDGTLEVVGGGTWSWSLLSFWRQERAFLHREHEPLVRVRPEITGRVFVTLSGAARSLPELPIMVMLGAYLAVMTADETATLTAAITAATATS